MREGARVRLARLKAAQFNGLVGDVVGFDANKGRWRVRVRLAGRDKGKVLALKSENLVVVADDEAGGAAGEDSKDAGSAAAGPARRLQRDDDEGRAEDDDAARGLKTLAHPLVEAMKRDDAEMRTFFERQDRRDVCGAAVPLEPERDGQACRRREQD